MASPALQDNPESHTEEATPSENSDIRKAGFAITTRAIDVEKMTEMLRSKPYLVETFLAAVAKVSDEHFISRKLTMDRVRKAIRDRRVAAGHPPAEAISKVRQGSYLDFETTGVDLESDKPIQIAMINFTFDSAGLLDFDEDIHMSFQDPGRPLDPAVVKLTGITDEMVAGKRFDFARINEMGRQSVLFCAHNAAFDRVFAERIGDPETEEMFRSKSWLCSHQQVDWPSRGFASGKLGLIAMEQGWRFEAHRADADVLAGIAILNHPPFAAAPEASHASSHDAFGEMARNGVKPSWRIWAMDSPYDTKDMLKARGYAWDADGLAGFKSWWVDIDDPEKVVEEKLWIAREVYPNAGGKIGVSQLNSLDRYSIRAWRPQRTEMIAQRDLEAAMQMHHDNDSPSL